MNANGPFFVYILASRTRVLYTGMTNDLKRRVWEHKNKEVPGFTANYNVNQLVWFDSFATAQEAINAEKTIKGWLRSKKVAMIQEANPRWRDFSRDFVEDCRSTTSEQVDVRDRSSARG